ncbi:hypothetical protein GGF44_005237 [Coemansia sp. RSA 1694]|nr:hypothetical protein GGF38_002202 [Coemansia sp. RSA 25]KAJ2583952.1 hypothetical protein GGH95_000700 [Coemansia sp. RSA 1836]KAJ2624697.1 hypothetical protein GGF44_005237 [Coemansia sp. RSA 1694]
MFGLGIWRHLSGRTLLATANAGAGRRLMSAASSNPPGTGIGSETSSGIEAADTASEDRLQFANNLTNMIHNIGSSVVGRAVPVTNGNPAKAYGRLNRILTENNVRRELFLRKRYEKPKYKRQRLRRESHARLFKEEVRRKVHLVMNMRNWGM